MSEGAQWLRLFKGLLSQYEYIQKQVEVAFESYIDSNNALPRYSPYIYQMADFKHDIQDSIKTYNGFKKENPKDENIDDIDRIIDKIMKSDGHTGNNSIYKGFGGKRRTTRRRSRY